MQGLIFPSAHLRAALPPEEFAEEILCIEAELDQLHPPWRQPARSRMGPGIVGSAGVEDLEKKARVKYLLQRRKHLYDGKNYEVVVTTFQNRRGQTKLLAHPIIPPAPTAETIAAAARRSWLAEQPQQATPKEIAEVLGAPLERVQRALLDAPANANLLSWARRKLQAEDVSGEIIQPVRRRRKDS